MNLIPTGIWVQLIANAVGCFGFSMLMRVHGRSLFWATFGSFFTWAVYLLVYDCTPFKGHSFIAVFLAAVYSNAFSQIMARVNKSPATIFRAICTFPLIPGANLYYMMYELVMGDNGLAIYNGKRMLSTCIAIIFGLMVTETVNKYMVIAHAFIKKKARRSSRSG